MAVTMKNTFVLDIKTSSYFTENTLHLRYKSQSVNALYDLRLSRRWFWRMSSLGYKNPVLTPLETHYVSTTESSRLMFCKKWDFYGGDYEECSLLGYKNSVHTSLETHYASATESSLLILCKIWIFHSSDYEECRLLGYRNPVRTSQETLLLRYRAQSVNAM
jgi:hypothetical protein